MRGAVAVAIVVVIPCAFINGAIAIFIHAISGLRCARINRCVCIVAVGSAAPDVAIAVSIGIGKAFVQTVVFRRTGIGEFIPVVAVGAVNEAVPIRIHPN